MKGAQVWGISMMLAVASAGPAFAQSPRRPRTTVPRLNQSSERTGILWLEDMDLPAHMPLTIPMCSKLDKQFSALHKRTTSAVYCINASGTMDYATAVMWVKALNAKGHLGRHNWQLPPTGPETEGCLSRGKDKERFGYQCTGSALGDLYYNRMGLKAPASAADASQDRGGGKPIALRRAFKNLQANYYWSSTSGDKGGAPKVGFFTFSFANGWRGSNIGSDLNSEPAASYFYVLPMLNGKVIIPGVVYDPNANVSWLADGNLAASNKMGLRQCKGLPAKGAPETTCHEACVNANGTMTQSSAQCFITNMNTQSFGGQKGYLGQTQWQLPSSSEGECLYNACATQASKDPLASLYYNLLGLKAGDSVAAISTGMIHGFKNVQPYLYWSCAAAEPPKGSPLIAPCSPTPQCTPAQGSPCPGTGPMEWSFNFGIGLQGTDDMRMAIFVTAVSPGPDSAPACEAGKPCPPHTLKPRPKNCQGAKCS